MKRNDLLTTAAAILVLLVATSSASAQSARNASRVDFDDQLVQGQVNRGAVHLIERKDSDLGSLVKVRKSYRKEILAGTAVETPAAAPNANVAVPTGLPVVKPADVNGTASLEALASPKSPMAKPAAEAKKSDAKKAAPAASAKKNESKKSSKSTTTKVGGTRAISRR